MKIIGNKTKIIIYLLKRKLSELKGLKKIRHLISIEGLNETFRPLSLTKT